MPTTTSTNIHIKKTDDGIDVSMTFDPPNPDPMDAKTLDFMLGLIAMGAIQKAIKNAEGEADNTHGDN